MFNMTTSGGIAIDIQDWWDQCDADSEWHVSDKFFKGREAIEAFLKAKWEEELDYRLVKELW